MDISRLHDTVCAWTTQEFKSINITGFDIVALQCF